MRALLVVSVIALTTGCASTGAVPRPFPIPGAGPATAPGAGSAAGVPTRSTDGYSISSTALALRGTPYRNGGADPRSGFDCSGFVRYVFEQHGVPLPRDVRSQFGRGQAIDPGAVAPGDLLFFSTVAPGASHVGIAVGGDQFVHAPSTNGVVRVEHLSSQYWSSRFIGARRVN